MANHYFRRVHEITGKLKGARVELTHLIAGKTYTHVEDIDKFSLIDVAIIKIGDYEEPVKFYEGRYYIKNTVTNAQAARFRAQAFMITDFQVAKAFSHFSTFDVLHYADAEYLQQGLPESGIGLVRNYEEYRDQALKEADEKLSEAVRNRLIECEGELYIAVGEPALFLRLIAGNLQVYVAFRVTKNMKSEIPRIVLPYDFVDNADDGYLSKILKTYEDASGKRPIVLSEVRVIQAQDHRFDYSFEKDILELAEKVVADEADALLWTDFRKAMRNDINNQIADYKSSDKYEILSEMMKNVISYAKFVNDYQIQRYALMLDVAHKFQPISLDFDVLGFD